MWDPEFDPSTRNRNECCEEDGEQAQELTAQAGAVGSGLRLAVNEPAAEYSECKPWESSFKTANEEDQGELKTEESSSKVPF